MKKSDKEYLKQIAHETSPAEVGELENAEKKERSDIPTVINRKAVREYIKLNGSRISQVDKDYYRALDNRIKQIILNSIFNNCSRKKLTASEIH